jgi:hypothetical protein
LWEAVKHPDWQQEIERRRAVRQRVEAARLKHSRRQIK